MLAILIFTSLFMLAVMNYAIWKPPADKGGFTVIESLTALAITAIICSGLLPLRFSCRLRSQYWG